MNKTLKTLAIAGIASLALCGSAMAAPCGHGGRDRGPAPMHEQGRGHHDNGPHHERGGHGGEHHGGWLRDVMHAIGL